ncbi:hypothetical protein ACIQAC_02815 [Streptomyces sp. NPDC088387]|uniref:hypothetical protein n=1 Tax=Streptomyces sp. NPDC088387 TaxID=3365859 RepID=UPI00382942CB
MLDKVVIRLSGNSEAPEGFQWLRYAGVFALLFLFGTETFLVSPLLPTISDDIGVSEAAAASSACTKAPPAEWYGFQYQSGTILRTV